ncbi:MAG: peptidase C39 [Pirellulaceae bacterium]
MNDLWIAMTAVILISLTLGVITAWIAPRHRQPQMLWIAISLCATFAFLFYAAGQFYWARLMPDSAVIVWSNLTPMLAAIAAGVCWRLDNTPRWRRLAMTMTLSMIVLASTLWPFLNISLRPQPNGGNAWRGPVAMQTSWATCSPAAAATFLTAGGIPIDEAAMIPRCLTDASGTPTLGLYRGVKLVAKDNGRDLEVDHFQHEALFAGEVGFPILMMVKLPISGVDDPRYAEQWGWIPGMGHSVVALGLSDQGKLIVADPAIGLEHWSEADMRVLWHGDAVRFAK